SYVQNDLFIQPAQFHLVCRGTDSKPDPYDLSISAVVHRKPDSGNFFSSSREHRCVTEDKASAWGLADWKASEHEKVRAVMDQFVKECLVRLEPQMGRLLEP
ncbi:MAG TPA: hypothetical protein VEZ89_02765, partial [Rubrivivax sp.]|nr:hypothetical protein [Rubrivivax sp.]